MVENEDFVLSQAWKGYDNTIAGLNAIEIKASNLIIANSILIAIFSIVLREYSVYTMVGLLILPTVSLLLSLWSIHGESQGPLQVKIPDLLKAINNADTRGVKQFKKDYAERIFKITEHMTSLSKEKAKYYLLSLYILAGALGLFSGFLVFTMILRI